MHVEPQQEHHWLQQLVGDWMFETECAMGPDQPASKMVGSESVRSLGGIWVLCEGRHEMPTGGAGITLMTLGYDPAKMAYLGNFVGSMMTHMWVYNGSLNGNVLTLDTEGPNFCEPGAMQRYQDILEIKDADHRVLTSQSLGKDGKWQHFMTAHYRRKK